MEKIYNIWIYNNSVKNIKYSNISKFCKDIRHSKKSSRANVQQVKQISICLVRTNMNFHKHPQFIYQEDTNMKIWNWRVICLFRYDVRHPKSLETYLEKVTGKKGPYDLFTGYSRSVLRVSNILHQSICFQGQGMKARSRAILQLWNWRIVETGLDRCQQKWTNCCINRIILRDDGPPVQGVVIKFLLNSW